MAEDESPTRICALQRCILHCSWVRRLWPLRPWRST